ncbi:cytochrome P450 3A24-like [Diadema antillarum]|uniref:cytochrome P450 3A24-like n=1 Tax=Diadema antillarum TaxID=105358 RepID=UPI003A89A998
MAFSLFGFTVSWPLVGALVGIIVGREIWRLTYFKRKGLPSPTPLPFLGNFMSFAEGIHVAMLRYTKTHGKVFGIYMFSQPVYVVSDPDIIQDMAVKSFSSFTNHQDFVLKNKPFDKGLTVLQDQHWKDVRNVITPTFSAAKMKKMSGLINECCDQLVRNIRVKQQKDTEINVNSIFESFTMDGIARCAFGLEVDSQNNPDDPFVTNAKEIVGGSLINPKLILAGILPPVAHVMNYFDVGMFPPGVTQFFTDVVGKAMKLRETSQGNEEKKDFLQLMMNAHKESEKVPEGKVTEDDVHSHLDDHHGNGLLDSKKTNHVKLTTEEIVAQAVFFFIAGYETTNVTLGFIAYSLATNPEIQDKLIQEVDEMAPDRDSVNYSSIAKMTYLDGVVCETLRLYPAASLTDRECSQDYTNKSLSVPKGCQVFFSIFSLHRDPEYWPNPEVFDPERFSKKNREGRHPFAWMPFGAGPRICVGMRFALMEIKMAVVRVLQKYRFETSPNSQVPVKLGKRSVKPESGIILSVVERE